MHTPLRKHWQVAAPISDSAAANLGEYPPLLQQLLFNREITTPEAAQRFLNTSGSLHSPCSLKGIGTAVECLLHAIDAGEEIVVYGDYDVDGVTATVLLVQLLRVYGAKARGYIPNRFDEGYGLNIEALEGLHQEGIRTVVTVDCGIRSPREAEYARAQGITLIITDHHEPEEEIPDAAAIVCPKQPGDEYPDKNLAGVGLAFKVAEAILSARPLPGVSAADWLDLVAIGTVADVVPMTGENRSLVKAGLRMLQTCRRPGVCSLANTAGLNLGAIRSHDIGFIIGPRLNAAGRLESALDAYSLLMQEDIAEAGLLAQKLDDQNRYRQELTRQMQEEAELLTGGGNGNELLFIAHPDFNMGVVGLVASRLTEQYYRPSVVATKGLEFTRGSCRSIPDFHITRALDQCSHLLVRHGGHAMAAGFTAKNENVPALEKQLLEIAALELGGKSLRPVLQADMEIGFQDLHPRVLEYLDALEPAGWGNPETVFVSRNVKVISHRGMGNEGRHLRLTLRSGEIVYDAVAFRQGFWAGQLPPEIDIMYSFEKNCYRGRESLQLNVRDIKPTNQPD
ncbi:MAG: single-stranded-DNA-specific exonuclease RecJ [Anaerolineaceae bacterium]|nr:single-stranded-DNA-specific exonuclease RecJ [Anaerolineaceae bacterium]